MQALSDAGARVFLYPAEDSEPVGTLLSGDVIYYRGD